MRGTWCLDVVLSVLGRESSREGWDSTSRGSLAKLDHLPQTDSGGGEVRIVLDGVHKGDGAFPGHDYSRGGPQAFRLGIEFQLAMLRYEMLPALTGWCCDQVRMQLEPRNWQAVGRKGAGSPIMGCTV